MSRQGTCGPLTLLGGSALQSAHSHTHTHTHTHTQCAWKVRIQYG